MSRQAKQEILDRVSGLLRGWLSTSARLPEESQDENNSVMRRYRPKTYSGDVHMFIAEECYESAGISERLDPRQAWKHLVTGKSYVHRMPGDHYTMLSHPNAQRVAEALKHEMHGARPAL
jgi:thioesterase domain-containing protein